MKGTSFVLSLVMNLHLGGYAVAYLRLSRPLRAKDSSVVYYRQRIPYNVLPRVRGLTLSVNVGPNRVIKAIGPKAEHIRVSLRTTDPIEAMLRHDQVSADLAKFYRALRNNAPLALTQEEREALSGEFYRGWTLAKITVNLASWSSEEGSGRESHPYLMRALPQDCKLAEIWETIQDKWRARVKDGSAETLLSPLVDRLLVDNSQSVDPVSRKMFTREMARALQDVFEARRQRSEGKYAPNPTDRRSLSIEVVNQSSSAVSAVMVAGRLSLHDLFAHWRKHPDQIGIAQSTVATYDRVLRTLGRHVGHSDAAQITRKDVEAFAAYRRTRVSAKTANASDLAALKSVFGWAVQWRLLETNPALGVRVKQRKQPTQRVDRGLTDEEARAILRHASNYKPRTTYESRKKVAAKRWLPWLMAYSGLRVGEVAQLRKQDVAMHEGVWALFISYDAGTTKSKSTWPIPLHRHLFEMGFLDFVSASGDGHLFLTPRPDLFRANAPESRSKDPRGILGQLNAIKNRLRVFVREVVPRVTASPNHGWRHRFKTIGRACQIETVVLNAFHDHAAANESDKYGGSFAAMVRALEIMPRYEIDDR